MTTVNAIEPPRLYPTFRYRDAVRMIELAGRGLRFFRQRPLRQ